VPEISNDPAVIARAIPRILQIESSLAPFRPNRSKPKRGFPRRRAIRTAAGIWKLRQMRLCSVS
jgi:hypothetical protein